jgi:hypothetical protein
VVGDAIEPVWSSKIADLPAGPGFFEGTDAEFLDDDHVMVVGQGGWLVTRASTAEIVASDDERRSIRVSADAGLAVMATRERDLIFVDTTDPAAPRRLRSVSLPAQGEDVSVHSGRALVGCRAEGALLFDADGAQIGVIDVADAFAVSLRGDRALVSDDHALTLWDLTDPAAPVELDRQPLTGPGRDLDWSGEDVAVGLGGSGVSIWSVAGDRLRHRADLQPVGSIFSVAIDGDDLWLGGWSATSLIDLRAEPPALRGAERPAESAMGLDARGGRALVADWFTLTSLQQRPGEISPALYMTGRIDYPSDPALRGPEPVAVKNGGGAPLSLRFSAPSRGYTLSGLDLVAEGDGGFSLSLAPGEDSLLEMTPPSDAMSADADLRWTSDDPDRSSGLLRAERSRTALGAEHPPMRLPGFVWPDASPRVFDIADERGKPILLVYFALF